MEIPMKVVSKDANTSNLKGDGWEFVTNDEEETNPELAKLERFAYKKEVSEMAVPFRRVSKTRGRMRRTHYKIRRKCNSKMPKMWCRNKTTSSMSLNCGTYKGKEVIKKTEE